MDSKQSLNKVFSVLQMGKFQKSGQKVKKSELHRAAKYGCIKTVKALIANGADANLVYEDIKKKIKLTPLELAVLGGHVEVVDYLLNVTSNANLNGLFIMACKNGDMEMVDFLEIKLEMRTEVKKEDKTVNDESLYSQLLEANNKIFKLSCQATIQSLEIKSLKRENANLKGENANLKGDYSELEKFLLKSQTNLFHRTAECTIHNLDSLNKTTKMEL